MTWRKRTLGELLDNFSVRAKDLNESSTLEFLGVSNDSGIVKTKNAAEAKREEYKIIEKGCIAYNPYRVNVGSIGLYDKETKGLISPAYVVFKPKKNSIKPELLLKFLKSSEGLRQIKFQARGTVRQALRFEDLCKIELTLPDYNEQEALFERLNFIESKSEIFSTELARQQNLVKQLRQAFLKEAIQGKLLKQNTKDGHAKDLLTQMKAEKERLITAKKLKKEKPLVPIKPEEIPFEIPENWVWCRLGEICLFITKGTTPDTRKIQSKGEIPYLKVYNIVNQKINFFYKPQFIDTITHCKELTRSIIYPGDVLMNIVGPPLGKIAIVPNDFPEWNINQALAFFRPIVTDINQFIYHYLCENSAIKKLIPLGVVGQDNLSLEQCRNLVFPLPPLAEQNRIVKKLEELMKYCDQLESMINSSKKQSELLLQGALRDALKK